jgi:hypothetical protein
MAAKRRSQTKKPTGPRSPRGTPGPTGPPPGPPGKNHTNEIAQLSAQVADVIRELQTQLTRTCITWHWAGAACSARPRAHR